MAIERKSVLYPPGKGKGRVYLTPKHSFEKIFDIHQYRRHQKTGRYRKGNLLGKVSIEAPGHKWEAIPYDNVRQKWGSTTRHETREEAIEAIEANGKP